MLQNVALASCSLQQCITFFYSNIFVQQNYLFYCVYNKEFLHYSVLTYEFLQ